MVKMDDYKWFFSGIGVSILSWIKNVFLKKRNKKIEYSQEPEKKETTLKSNVSSFTETDQLTQRFQHVLTLMNFTSCYGGFTKAKLAKIMKLDKISSLEKYSIGEEEPSFEFLEQFCETFGINYLWMTEGIEQPFNNNKYIRFYPINYYDDIECLQPEEIYFIRCESEISEFFIVLKLTDWKYIICNRIWHLSDHVGRTGSLQLVSFYNLINKLRNNGFYLKCFGRTLTPDKFEKLYCGQVFPAEIINFDRMDHPWWDDFTDINNDYPISKNYLKMYGQSFINAQRIVRTELEYRKY